MFNNLKCVECGSPLSDSSRNVSRNVCDDCFNDIRCDKCGVLFYETGAVPMRPGYYYCPDCESSVSYDVNL